MHAREYMHERGYTSEDLGHVAIAHRAHAVLNPHAMMRTPLTMEDYLGARWISEPFRLYDCCLETDAAVALVVTSTERARDLRQPLVTISAVAFGGGFQLTSNGFANHVDLPRSAMAHRLYDAAGVGPNDIDLVEFYDAFTTLVLLQLEAYGFCGNGEAGAHFAEGHGSLTGSLPINTHGGNLSAGYVHGLNHVAEAVSQLRGHAGERQVPNAEVALSTAQPGVFSGQTSAAILRRHQ
jgi:acetyl-CoA acetyltransferase